MSRSHKKVGAYPIASSYGDKWDRAQYHRQERRKVKMLLQQVDFSDLYYPENEKDLGDVFKCPECMLCMDCQSFDYPYEDIEKYTGETHDPDWNTCYDKNGCGEWFDESNPIDKIVNSKIDRSLPFADKWSWGSDGGSYWRDDLSTIRKEFDTEMFSAKDAYKTSDVWEDYVKLRERKLNSRHRSLRICYEVTVHGKENPWWDKNILVPFERLERKSIEIPYNKQHKIPEGLLPEGAKIVGIYRYTSYNVGYAGENRWSSALDMALNKAPLSFEKPEELIEWLRVNEEKFVKACYNRRFGK